MAFTKCISFISFEMMPVRAEREREEKKTNTSQNMNDRNVTKIAVRVFHSAKIYHIHSVCLYLHGHEHTKYTESVFPKPKYQ